MKEYKTNLMDITWSYRKVLLMLVLLAFDLLMNYTVAQNGVLPIWLNNSGVLLAACVGGPGYGVILALVEIVVQIMVGGAVKTLVQGIAVVAIAAAFGTYVRLGFFGSIKGVLFGILAISFINTCIRTPEYFALFGSFSSINAAGTALIRLLTEVGLPLPFVSALSLFIIDMLDKAIILFALYGILRHRPMTIAKLFDIEDPLPQCVIVRDQSEKEFQTEKEQLMERAQKKLEEKKAKEEGEKSITQKEKEG